MGGDASVADRPRSPTPVAIPPSGVPRPTLECPPATPHCCCCRRRYGRALELLLSALSAPTLVLSAITVACLKKWMLLHLLDRGSVPQLPKHTAPLVT